jgi:N-acetylmuramoyl-L-alanine amidase
MNLRKLIFVNNACYKVGEMFTPKGIMVHSTGANNPWLKRYVGPDDGLLGKNQYNNHWNQAMDRKVCVHAFIGKLADGTIATYQTLPWDMRGWHGASGNKGCCNDTHIGFEICEDNLTDPVYFKQVYQEAVELCVYLCNLYGLTEKNIICHSEGHAQGIASNHGDVMHWFPKHGKSMDTFRADVKALLNKGASSAPVTPSVPATDNESVIWNFLKSKGLNDFAVAGIMGNLYAESGLKPTNLQNSYESKLGYTDDTYTAAVDSGAYTNFVKDSAGYGLAQWTFWSRKQALLDYAHSAGKSIGDLTVQLEFMWKEMQGYKTMMETLKGATSILEASNAVLLQYERPADQSEAVQSKRVGYGKTYYDKYVQSAPTPAPTATLYRVQVGAYSKRENADRQLAAVQGKGFDALIKKVGDLYKVQTGAYSVKANAEAQLARVKAAGFEDAYITTDSRGTVVATSPQESEPTYTTYVVKDGDTLWLIAKKLLGNGNRWSEIATLNGIKGTIIYAGQKLKIPD